MRLKCKPEVFCCCCCFFPFEGLLTFNNIPRSTRVHVHPVHQSRACWVLPPCCFSGNTGSVHLKESRCLILLPKNPRLQRHFLHASCPKTTAGHQLFPWVSHLQSEHGDCPGSRLPAHWPKLGWVLKSLPFAKMTISLSCVLKGWSSLTAFSQECQNRRPNSLPASKRSHKAEEVPQSKKDGWMNECNKIAKELYGFYFFFSWTSHI